MLLQQGVKKPQESIRPPVAELLIKIKFERFSILHNGGRIHIKLCGENRVIWNIHSHHLIRPPLVIFSYVNKYIQLEKFCKPENIKKYKNS